MNFLNGWCGPDHVSGLPEEYLQSRACFQFGPYWDGSKPSALLVLAFIKTIIFEAYLVTVCLVFAFCFCLGGLPFTVADFASN